MDFSPAMLLEEEFDCPLMGMGQHCHDVNFWLVAVLKSSDQISLMML